MQEFKIGDRVEVLVPKVIIAQNTIEYEQWKRAEKEWTKGTVIRVSNYINVQTDDLLLWTLWVGAEASSRIKHLSDW